MAKTIIEGRNVLVVGIDNALGRACAQQLSRAKCRVILAARDEEKLETLSTQLIKKGGDPVILVLPEDNADWSDLVRKARDLVGHVHLVVNTAGFCYENDADRAAAEQDAAALDRACAEHLFEHGPLKLLTFLHEDSPIPAPIAPDAWHGYVVLGPHQRLDTQAINELDATGTFHLRAGAAADAVVCLLQLPPSARPATIRLEGIPSAEKKK